MKYLDDNWENTLIGNYLNFCCKHLHFIRYVTLYTITGKKDSGVHKISILMYGTANKVQFSGKTTHKGNVVNMYHFHVRMPKLHVFPLKCEMSGTCAVRLSIQLLSRNFVWNVYVAIPL